MSSVLGNRHCCVQLGSLIVYYKTFFTMLLFSFLLKWSFHLIWYSVIIYLFIENTLSSFLDHNSFTILYFIFCFTEWNNFISAFSICWQIDFGNVQTSLCTLMFLCAFLLSVHKIVTHIYWKLDISNSTS